MRPEFQAQERRLHHRGNGLAESDVHSGASEGSFGYDGLDNDCNGRVDDGGNSIPHDQIGDEFEDSDLDGHSPCEGDCDDTLTTVNPLASEVCDGIDNDCDGAIDPGC